MRDAIFVEDKNLKDQIFKNLKVHENLTKSEKKEKRKRILSMAEVKRRALEKRKNEMHKRLKIQREKDEEIFKVKIEKLKNLRDGRFQKLLVSTTGSAQQNMQSEINKFLKEIFDQQKIIKKEKFKKWNEDVFENIQTQSHNIVNALDRKTEQNLLRSKSVSFLDEKIDKIFYPKNPLKLEFYEKIEEEKFFLQIEKLLKTKSPERPEAKTAFGNCKRPFSFLVKGLSPDLKFLKNDFKNSRPSLQPELWEKVRLSGTPFGEVFSGPFENPNHKFLMKLKNFNREILVGERAAGLRFFAEKNGQTEKFKDRKSGGGCGAPLQNHFNFPKGEKVTAEEFPKGKKIQFEEI